MDVKVKILLEKLTQVVSQSVMKNGLPGIHICRVIKEKQGFYFFAGNCKSVVRNSELVSANLKSTTVP